MESEEIVYFCIEVAIMFGCMGAACWIGLKHPWRGWNIQKPITNVWLIISWAVTCAVFILFVIFEDWLDQIDMVALSELEAWSYVILKIIISHAALAIFAVALMRRYVSAGIAWWQAYLGICVVFLLPYAVDSLRGVDTALLISAWLMNKRVKERQGLQEKG